MCFNQTGYISTLNSSSLKLVDKFTYLGSSVSSTKTDIEVRLTKAWAAINWLSVIWKLDVTDKMKRSFFQAAILSILLYGCTTWTLTKRLEKMLDGNYTKCCQLYWTGPRRNTPQNSSCTATHHLSSKLSMMDEPDMQDTAGEVGTSSYVMYYNGTLHMAQQKQGDQFKPTYIRCVRKQGVALRTCRKRWTIGRDGERGSGISVSMAQQDDDFCLIN